MYDSLLLMYLCYVCMYAVGTVVLSLAREDTHINVDIVSLGPFFVVHLDVVRFICLQSTYVHGVVSTQDIIHLRIGMPVCIHICTYVPVHKIHTDNYSIYTHTRTHQYICMYV